VSRIFRTLVWVVEEVNCFFVVEVAPLSVPPHVSESDTQSPNPEQALIYQHLSICWKAAFAPTKSCAN
jgi:hypothetical protein